MDRTKSIELIYSFTTNGNGPDSLGDPLDHDDPDCLRAVVALQTPGLDKTAAIARMSTLCPKVAQALAQMGDGDPVPTVPAAERLADMGNARRLARLFGDRLRFCERLGGWFYWDGHRWAKDETGQAVMVAKASADTWYDDPIPDSKAEAAALLRWRLQSQMKYRIMAALALAQSEPIFACAPDRFDRDPWALNVLNGTIDLHTGVLQPHNPQDYMTKLAPVHYDPHARSDLLDRYIAEATDGDLALAQYLQRAIGYSLTGDVSEEAFFMVLGPAATGKTTLIESLLAILGDYGRKTGFATFLQQRNPDGPRPDLAALRGVRLVAACETASHRRLAEPLIKELTGGDTLTARHLYAEAISFKPQCKVWLAANDSPRLCDDDTGLWRRLRRVPFEHEIPADKRDPTIKARLSDPKADGQALLTWAVKGCLAWQADGLGTCEAVETKTAALQAEANPVGAFFEACCTFGPSLFAPAGELRAVYEAWAKEQGVKPLGGKALGQRLGARGCESERRYVAGKRARGWAGVGLLDAVSQDLGL